MQDSHPAIIDPETFEKVQRMMQRKKGNGHTSSPTAFSSKIKFGDCGSWYGSKVWHSTDRYRKIIYQCNHKFADKAKKCRDEATAEINRLLFEQDKTQRFLKELKKLPETVTEFDEDSWYALIDYLTAHRDGRVVFRFKDGKEVEVKK